MRSINKCQSKIIYLFYFYSLPLPFVFGLRNENENDDGWSVPFSIINIYEISNDFKQNKLKINLKNKK